MICGNGGSAADSQHLAAEFLVRLTSEVNREGIPAISLAQDTSTLTACGNDFSFSDIFSRQISTLAQENDCLISFSTSGESDNILKALNASIHYLDNDSIYLITGQPRFNMDKMPIKVIKCPSKGDTETYQEFHLLFVHILCNVLELIY